MSKTDYAVYGTRKLKISHTHWNSAKELGEFLYADAVKAITDSREGMAFHQIGERRYLVMSGEGAPNSTNLWSWRLMELRAEHENGSSMGNNIFDSVPERHYAPVIFMDRDIMDDDTEITFSAFRPKDRKHFELSAVGYEIQQVVINQARTVGKGDVSMFGGN